jgi:hypothetical protein
VQLKVSADEPLKGSLQKLLTTELTALPQVLLADAEPDYIISVIALKVVTQSSKDVGVTFSVLVTAPYELKIREFAESHVAPEDRAKLSTLLSGVVKPLAHWVETASASQLGQVCRSIVQSFARDVLAAANPLIPPSGDTQTPQYLCLQHRAAPSIPSRRQMAWAASDERKPRESRRRSERT